NGPGAGNTATIATSGAGVAVSQVTVGSNILTGDTITFGGGGTIAVTGVGLVTTASSTTTINAATTVSAPSMTLNVNGAILANNGTVQVGAANGLNVSSTSTLTLQGNGTYKDTTGAGSTSMTFSAATT